MNPDLVVRVTTVIHASAAEVWQALVSPKAIKEYMFGAEVVSDWHEGSSITWQGEWQGKPYQDKGLLLQLRPRKLLQYSHYSPRSGLPDVQRHYHTVTIELTPEQSGTHVALTQDHNATEEERASSEKNWVAMLVSLKKYVEGHPLPMPERVLPSVYR